MTRVLVDLLFFSGVRGGMESYVRRLYAALSDVAPDLEFVALASRELVDGDARWFPGEVVDSRVRSSDRRQWALGELTKVGPAARRVGADLIHAPANVGPWRTRVPTVLTVHDLLAFSHPEWVPGPYAPVLRTLVRGSTRWARRVITVSEASRADLETRLAVDPALIDVTPLGSPQEAPPEPGAIRAHRELIAVANDLPHKNLQVLLEAFADPRLAEWHLTLFGGTDGSIARRALELRLTNVTIRGWVPAAELDAAYRTATALVLPTLFEGFGLPVLEAMSRGCPVICSDLPVLREVGGIAPLYVVPRSVDSIVEAVHRLDSEAPRRSRDGLTRAAQFTWSETARRTAESFRHAVR